MADAVNRRDHLFDWEDEQILGTIKTTIIRLILSPLTKLQDATEQLERNLNLERYMKLDRADAATTDAAMVIDTTPTIDPKIMKKLIRDEVASTLRSMANNKPSRSKTKTSTGKKPDSNTGGGKAKTTTNNNNNKKSNGADDSNNNTGRKKTGKNQKHPSDRKESGKGPGGANNTTSASSKKKKVEKSRDDDDNDSSVAPGNKKKQRGRRQRSRSVSRKRKNA